MIRQSIFGRELKLMLHGLKPMAVFYKATGERFDETDGQEFWKHVQCGGIERSRFFVHNDGQAFITMYTVYVLPEERWRVPMYKALKKSGQSMWSQAMEDFEHRLLNY
jgi:hypothetical protein